MEAAGFSAAGVAGAAGAAGFADGAGAGFSSVFLGVAYYAGASCFFASGFYCSVGAASFFAGAAASDFFSVAAFSTAFFASSSAAFCLAFS